MVVSHLMNAMVIKELLVGASVKDLVDITGVHQETLKKMTKVLYDQGVVYIDRWDPDKRGYPNLRVFRLRTESHQVDAIKPVKESTLARRALGHKGYQTSK